MHGTLTAKILGVRDAWSEITGLGWSEDRLLAGLLGKLTHGNWPARLITAAEIVVGLMAVMVIAALLSRSPFLLLFLAFGQVLFVIGIARFASAAIFAQRAPWSLKDSTKERRFSARVSPAPTFT